MKPFLAILAAVLALSACDSFGGETYTPSDPSTLIGAWRAEPSSRDLFVTPAVNIDVPDFERVQGALTVRGAVSADLRTVARAHRGDNRPLLEVSTANPDGDYLGAPRVSLNVTGGHVQVIVTGGYVPIYFTGGEIDGAPAISYADGILTLVPATLRADDGAEVRVGGALTVATTRFRAGQERLLRSQSGTVSSYSEEEWIFGGQGAFERRIEKNVLFGTRTRVEEGGWEILGSGRIALALRPDEPLLYTLEGSEGTARLIEDSVTSGGGDDLTPLENDHFLPVGSVLEARVREVFTLTR